jgi:TPR repeat protein
LSEDGLMQDRDVAKKWFEKSAKQDFEDAVLILKRDY